MFDCHWTIRLDHRATREERDRYADWMREEGEALGVEKFCGIMKTRGADVEEARAYNSLLGTLVEENPDLLHGWVRLNPLWGDDGVAEFRRAVEEDGLLGLKFVQEIKCDDPRFFPFAEACVDMDVPVKIHTTHKPSGPSEEFAESFTTNVAALAGEFPDLKILASHIGGGGDWEYRIKNIRDYDNVYLDISGTGCEAGMVEMAAEELGVDRLVYGSDNAHIPCVGKLVGADLTPEEKAEIAYNTNAILAEDDPHRFDEDELTERRVELVERFRAAEEPREETIVDANAYVGHWPFRELDASVEGLLARMDEEGVDRAAVSSLESTMYRNVHPGNRKLADRIEDHRDRLIPFATINPTYPAWREDLRECVEEYDMRGVRLLPAYHDYDLDDLAVEALFEACAEHDVPAMVVAALEDQRQRHPRVELRDVSKDTYTDGRIGDLIGLLRAVPETDVIVADAYHAAFEIAEAIREPDREVWRATRDREGETLFVLDDLRMRYVRQGERIAEEIGAEHLVCGAQLPFKVFESYHQEVEHLPVTEGEREAVRSGNLLSLLE